MYDVTKRKELVPQIKSIAYQNKDVAAKYLADGLRGKTLKAYGLPHIKIVDILPTNLPSVEANELRIDNLFLLEDGSIGLLDYESTYNWEDKVKHVNYIARILKRYQRQGKIHELKRIRLIIIFTADIERADILTLDVGCMKIYIEPVYLVGINTLEVFEKIKNKAVQGQALTDEELMELIILPLTVKGIRAKRKMLDNAVKLAKMLSDEEQGLHALAGLLTFSDKFVDKEFAMHIKEEIKMLKVERLIFDEGLELGEKRGEKRGEQRGEERFALLTERLLKDSRIEDLTRAANDKYIREIFYEEYGIKNEK